MSDQQGPWGTGAPAPGQAPPTAPGPGGYGTPAPPGPRGGNRRSGGWNPVSVVAVCGVIVLVVMVVFLALNLASGGDDPDPDRTVEARKGDDTTTASTTTVTTTSTTVAPTTEAASPSTVVPVPTTTAGAPSGGGGLPSGLFCRDLVDRGVSYAGAVDYWFAEGAPDRMDADLNGIPCETVYPSSVVEDYWG